MKIEMCEETKWAVVITTIVLGIVLTIGWCTYQTNETYRTAIKQGLVEKNDRCATTHWEKP